VNIRRSQINSVLNETNEFNAKAFALCKKYIQGTCENVLPYNALNTEVISSNKAVITQLITVLERKKQDMNNILATVYPTGNNNKQLDLFNDITNFEEVLRLYNTAVEMYLGLKAPNMTQQTKLEMLGNMKKIAPPLNYIVSGIRQKIQFYHHHNRDAGQRQQIGKLFARYTDAYSCYSLILNQTQTGELHQISRSDLEASIKTAISHIPGN
jgi:uncharacterized protein YdiU (UPF0061 family)